MIYNLQVLRALAAFAVVFVHMDLFAIQLGIEKRWLEFGNAGVDVFFVLSGFLMVHTSVARPPGAIYFFANRILRIAPLYWAITIVVFTIAYLDIGLLGATRANWMELVKSILFIPFYKSNGLIMPVLFVGWTINYEMFFYIIFAFFIGVTQSRVVVTAVLATSLIICIVLAGAWFRPEALELRFLSKPIILEFAFGMVLALALGRDRALGRRQAWWFLLFSSILLLGGATYLPGWPRWIVSGIPAAFLLCCAVSLERHGIYSKKSWLLLLGDSSYALYLTHPFALQGLGKLLPQGSPLLLVWAVLLCAIALAFLMAILIYKFLERPMTHWLRQKLDFVVPKRSFT